MTFHKPSGNVQVSFLICISVSFFHSLPSPPLPSHPEVRKQSSAQEYLHRFSPPTAISNVHCWGGAQSHASLFSFHWLKPVSLSLFLCLSRLFLCAILADQYRDRKTMNVFSPKHPPPPPPVFSAVSQRTEWRGEIYSTAAMLMMISFFLNSRPVKGIRTDARKTSSSAYFTLTSCHVFVCMSACVYVWLMVVVYVTLL